MATSCWNNCCCMRLIYKLLGCYRNYKCIMFSLGISLRIKWNYLSLKIFMFCLYNINCLWKCWYWWHLLLGSSNWNCNNRNLQTLTMFRCHYKLVNTYWMCCIFRLNCLHNLRNSLYSLSHMFSILIISWLRLRNRWSLLLGNNHNSCNRNNSCYNLNSLQTEIMHRFIINIKCFMFHCNYRSQMCF